MNRSFILIVLTIAFSALPLICASNIIAEAGIISIEDQYLTPIKSNANIHFNGDQSIGSLELICIDGANKRVTLNVNFKNGVGKAILWKKGSNPKTYPVNVGYWHSKQLDKGYLTIEGNGQIKFRASLMDIKTKP